MIFDITQAIRFTDSLHGLPSDQISSSPIDWSQAPSFFPSMHNKGRIELPLPIMPGTWNLVTDYKMLPPLEQLSLLLWLSCGCHQVRIDPQSFMFQAKSEAQSARSPGVYPRRVLASGGACYPFDLFCIFGKKWEHAVPGISESIYQYSPNFHALMIHQLEPSWNKLSPIIGCQEDEIVIFLSINFSRTAFKYGNFTYRLSAVDTGILLGRLCYLFEPYHDLNISFDFSGSDIDTLLDLNIDFQGTYAILKISGYPQLCSGMTQQTHIIPSCQQSPSTQPQLASDDPHIPPELRAMHRLSQDYHTAGLLSNHTVCENPPIEMMDLNTLISAIRYRESNADSFNGNAVNSTILLATLAAAFRAIHQIKVHHDNQLPSVDLYCAILNVSGYTEGLYKYDPNQQSLMLIQERKLGKTLTDCLHLSTANIGLSSFIIHLAGHVDLHSCARGPKEYRVQQMMVGAAIDAATLEVCKSRLSAHPYLGFDGYLLSSFYGLVQNKILAQLCIGVTRQHKRFNASMII